METSPNAAAIRAAVVEITAGIRRLSGLSRGEGEMVDMVTVLEALEGADGPLAAIGDLCSAGAEWLPEFEDEDADKAAERLDDVAGQTETVRYGLDIVLRLIRPLAG